MAHRIYSSIGHHGFWGMSATFDFIQALEIAKTLSLESSSEPIRILLIQPGDIRHIITTIARRRRALKRTVSTSESLRPIHFYVIESLVEIIGRDLLLLELLNDFEVPIRQRANLFLEVYGNVKVQERTNRYIEQLGQRLRALVTDGRGCLEEIVELSLLKYRERDELEDVFKSYSRSNPFDINSLWDHRLRGYYAERYDSRKSLSDWDWQFVVKPGASIVHTKLYKEWRFSGIAFEFGDQVYDQPNRTLMSYAEGIKLSIIPNFTFNIIHHSQ